MRHSPILCGNRRHFEKKRAAAAGSFKMIRRQKKRGGFHPDFALSWESGGKSYHALFCFTCHEVIFSNGSRNFRHGMADSQALQDLFSGYAAKRPPKR